MEQTVAERREAAAARQAHIEAVSPVAMPVLPKKRQRREVETSEYLDTVVRRTIVRAGQRVADADEVELAQLLALREVLDQAIVTAIAGQRKNYGRSWEWIARAAGVTRSAVFQAWGAKVKAVSE